MIFSKRQKQILALIEREGRVRVEGLAADFDTTPQTIRKDLQRLAEEHRIVRFHGGAALLAGTEYVNFEARRVVSSPQKNAIGQAVAKLVPPHSTLFINSGTTTEQAALSLAQTQGLRLIVDNIEIANKIRNYSGIEVIVAGGQVRGSDGAIIGPQAVDFFRGFKADYALIGAAALDAEGTLLDYDLQEVAVAKAIMENARHIILAIDAMKFDRTAPVKFGSISDVHTLVTDDRAPDWVSRLCLESDVDLKLMPTGSNVHQKRA